MVAKDLASGPVGLWGTGRVSGTIAMQALRLVAKFNCLFVDDMKNTSERFEKMSRDPRVSKGRGAREPWQLQVGAFRSLNVRFGDDVVFVGEDEDRFVDVPLTRGELVMPAESGLPRRYILGALMTVRSERS